MAGSKRNCCLSPIVIPSRVDIPIASNTLVPLDTDRVCTATVQYYRLQYYKNVIL